MNGFYVSVIDVTGVQTVWTRAVLSLVHSLWIGAAAGALVLVALLLLRGARRHNARYTVLVAALLAVAMAPVVVFVSLAPETATASYEGPNAGPPVEVPGRMVMTRPLVDPAAHPVPAGGVPTIPARLVDEAQNVYVVPEVVGPPYADAGLTPVTREGAPQAWRIAVSPKAIVFAYLIIAGALIARLAFGIAGGSRLRRSSQLVTDGAVLSALARHTQSLGMRITPAIAYCARVAVPTVVGIVRPMILLPLSAATGMTPEQVEYLVLHELAHIRRYDHLMNLVQRVIEALMFYHPVVWLLSRQIRIEREHCCDDVVLRLGGDAQHYAESLLAAATLAHGLGGPSAVPSLGATGKASHLRQRIARILGEPAPAVRLRHTGWMFAAITALIGAAAIAQLRDTGGPTAGPAAPTALAQAEPVAQHDEAAPVAQAPVEKPTTPPAQHAPKSTVAGATSPGPSAGQKSSEEQFRQLVEAKAQTQDKDWWLRKLAVQQLVECQHPEAWKNIVPLLNDEDERVQAAAAVALGQIKEPRSIKHLVAALKEGEEPSDAAAKALAQFDPALVMPLVRMAAADEDVGVRCGAVKALGEVKSPETIDVLIDLLGYISLYGDATERPRVVGTQRSGQVRPPTFYSDPISGAIAGIVPKIAPSVFHEVIGRGSHHGDWHVRAGLMKVLAKPLFDRSTNFGADVQPDVAARINSDEVVQVQNAALADAQKDVRAWATIGIGRGYAALTNDPKLNETRRAALVRGLRDPNLQIAYLCGGFLRTEIGGMSWAPANDDDTVAFAVATQNIEALATLGQKAVPSLVAALTADPSFPLSEKQDNPINRNFIAKALAQIGGPDAVDPLIGMLGTTDKDTVYSVCEALGNIGDPRAVEPLIQVAGGINLEAQYAAIQSLGKLKDKRAFDAVAAALSSPNIALRTVAVEGLGAIGDTRATPLLSEILQEDSENSVRQAAAEGLGNLNDPTAAPALSNALTNDQGAEVRRRVAISLGKLGGPEARDALITALRTNSDESARASAAGALGDMKDPAAIGPLSEALQFDTEKLKSDAARAIVGIGTPEAFAALKAIFPQKGDGSHNATALYITEALCDGPTPSALDVLFDLLQEGRFPAAQLELMAARALAEKNDPRAKEFLDKLRGTPETRIDSERALMKLEGKAVPLVEFRPVVEGADAEGKTRVPAPTAAEPDRTLALADEVWLTEKDMASATVRTNEQMGEPEVVFTTKPEAAIRLIKLTEANNGRPIAIVYKGRVLSAPVIRGPIGTSGTISGVTREEAEDIAAAVVGTGK